MARQFSLVCYAFFETGPTAVAAAETVAAQVAAAEAAGAVDAIAARARQLDAQRQDLENREVRCSSSVSGNWRIIRGLFAVRGSRRDNANVNRSSSLTVRPSRPEAIRQVLLPAAPAKNETPAAVRVCRFAKIVASTFKALPGYPLLSVAIPPRCCW